MKDVEQNLLKHFCYKIKIVTRRVIVQIIRKILKILKAIKKYFILTREVVTERKEKVE